jgi:hypothetical protein
MKKKQFESVCKTFLPDLPGFTCKGWLLYAKPMSHILRGFCCDGSSFDPSIFTVTVFVLPLYVPTAHLHFNYGHRLRDERGCDKWWNIEEPALASKLLGSIQREGLPFLDGARDPSQLAALVDRLPGNTNPHSLEAIAYSLAITDDHAGARSALNRLLNTLDVKIGWQAEMMERAKQLADKLNTDPQAAKQILTEWEQATVKNLGL